MILYKYWIKIEGKPFRICPSNIEAVTILHKNIGFSNILDFKIKPVGYFSFAEQHLPQDVQNIGQAAYSQLWHNHTIIR